MECPKCKSKEMHPTQNVLLIRAYKVRFEGYWKSQCLVCAGGYSKDLSVFTQDHVNPHAGWF